MIQIGLAVQLRSGVKKGAAEVMVVAAALPRAVPRTVIVMTNSDASARAPRAIDACCSEHDGLPESPCSSAAPPAALDMVQLKAVWVATCGGSDHWISVCEEEEEGAVLSTITTPWSEEDGAARLRRMLRVSSSVEECSVCELGGSAAGGPRVRAVKRQAIIAAVERSELQHG